METLELYVPPSKSETHRAFVQSGLADGTSEIYDPLDSTDTEITRLMMQSLGAEFTKQSYGWSVKGNAGELKNPGKIYVGECGFAARVGLALAATFDDWVPVEGDALDRPMKEGFKALRSLGAKIKRVKGSVRVKGPLLGGHAEISGSESSQHISALLYAGTLAATDAEVEIFGKMVSQPYFNLTRNMAEAAEIRSSFERRPYLWRLNIPARQTFRPATYRIGGDHTSAAHIAEAAILHGRKIRLKNLDMSSRQGDKRFFEPKGYGEQIGLSVKRAADFVEVEGRVARGLREDLSQHPDLVPSLAVLDAFAPDVCGSVLYNIGFLEGKESKRLSGLATQLSRVGVRAYVVPKKEPKSLVVYGSGGRVKRDVRLDAANDHRMAMALEGAGLLTNNNKAHLKSLKNWPEYLRKIRGN